MTFLQLQNRVMTRLNQSSAESRALIKDFLNERYRDVQSSVGTAATRRGLITFDTFAGTNLTEVEDTTTSDTPAKVLSVFDPVVLKRPLTETTLDEIRAKDAADTTTGTPTHYAIVNHENDRVTLYLWPKPAANGTLMADVLKSGTDMDANTDEPTIPTDFHDVLIHGACSDFWTKTEKPKLASVAESKYEKRLADLRYFIAKSAYLHRYQQDNTVGSASRRVWPYSNLAV